MGSQDVIFQTGSVPSQTDLETSVNLLSCESTPDDALATWLSQANENISFLNRKNEIVVTLILKLNWTERSEEVIRIYSELVLNLVTAYNIYLRSVLKMIIKYFTPISDEKVTDVKPSVHNLLQGICRLIPSTPSILLPMLADSFPYMKKSVNLQECYLKNLFYLIRYLPNSRPAVLEIIIIRLLQLDVHCPRDVILEAEDQSELPDSNSVFAMETNEPVDETRHPLANILDVLLNVVYEYMKFCCFSTDIPGTFTERLNWDATKKVYKEVLTVFDSVILPTHACAHVQFVMFYICSFKNLLCEGFVDYLWKKVQNPNVSSVIRQASVCYIGSFLARAKYIHIRMVLDCLVLMCSWVNSYIDSQTGSSYTYADAVHHSTFYAVCQVVLYLVTFRHKEMVHNKKSRQILQELNLERIVNCRLNPLRVCLPVVVKNFASVARNYQLAYCYTIIERNTRLFLPANSDPSCPDLTSFTSLETYFPFDPYLLKKSSKEIQPLYREYEHQEDSSPEIEENYATPENGIYGSPPVQSLFPDLLHHASSPGYRQHDCVSPKFR